MELNCKKNNIKKLFINNFLKKGKKTNSEKIFKNILRNLKKKNKKSPINTCEKALNILSPKIKMINITNKKKIKNKSFIICLNKDKQINSALKWLIPKTKSKKKLNLKGITNEIIKLSQKKGDVLNKKKQSYMEIIKSKYNLTI